MMPDFTAEMLTDVVLAEFKAPDPRLQQVITAMITHLHAFVREVRPTEAEWFTAIDFLTRTGQKCDQHRQEFILLSDTLGITALVDALNHDSADATASTVTGPFYRPAPVLENGAIIARGAEWQRGEWTRVHGKVTDAAGRPLAGARLEVWQSDDAGHYDAQDAQQPDVNLRGTFITGEDGGYWFRTVKPSSYPVPVDGPVGELLTATGRHPMRPAHIHFKITAPACKHLTTHLFVAGDPYLASDAVFAVKQSLVADFARNESPEAAAQYGFPGPFYDVTFDIRLQSALPANQR